MRQNKFTVDQIIKILAEAELPGSSVQQIARKYNVSPNTIYRWRSKYKGLSSSEAKRLKVLLSLASPSTSILNLSLLKIPSLTQNSQSSSKI